jgi:hypothetical protein
MVEEASSGRTFREMNPLHNPKCPVQIPMRLKITPTRPVKRFLERHRGRGGGFHFKMCIFF